MPTDSGSPLARGIRFAGSQGFKTYDPYDLKGCPTVMGTYRLGSFGRIVRIGLYAFSFPFPYFTRRLFKVKKQASAGGMAHFARAVLADGDSAGAKAFLNWLVEDAQAIGNGLGWGLPFPWASGVAEVPARTPIGHTTMTVGKAFLAYAKACPTDSEWALERAIGACQFLIESLHRTERQDGSIALSYTPLDRSLCINSNADNAALLLAVGNEVKRKDMTELGQQIVDFVVRAQNSDGSWNYFADRPDSIIDNYHTGMTLSALVEAIPFVKTSLRDSLVRGFEFWISNLFEANGLPRFAKDRTYPVDVYSCGQAILTLCDAIECPELLEIRPRLIELREKVVSYTVTHMQKGDGSFHYRRYRFGHMELGSLRWAQALCCWALARYHNR